MVSKQVGVENDYQAFNTNQDNNLGLWIEESLVTANISAINKQLVQLMVIPSLLLSPE